VKSFVSRRRLLAGGAAGLLLAACGPAATPTATTAPPKPTTAPPPPPTSAPATTNPAATAPTAAPAPAATKPAAAATTGATPAAKPTVALAAKSGTLTVYSGRTESLIGPLLQKVGFTVQARYGDSAQLAAAILEEGGNSPADLFFSQDAGALGAVAAEGKLIKLPDAYLNKVEDRFRSPKGEWVGLSGRARVLNYNTNEVKESDLPDSVHGLTDAKWKGKVGWVPTNASFQSQVTAMRLAEGDAAIKSWLQAMKANGTKVYQGNAAQVQATGAGEILVSTPNHYYVYSFYKDQGDKFAAKNYHPRGGGPDAMINVAGAGILQSSKNRELAERFVEYMLGTEAQQYFADQTFEYPLIPAVKTHPQLKPLGDIKTPKIDLGSLTDLKGTLKLLQEAGVL
jgi:iron(III) transport system substrate-binding protein